MNYDSQTLLKRVPEFQQLKRTKVKYSGPLSKYNNITIDEFIKDYKNKGLKGKEVYDELIKLIAPEEYESEQKGPEVKIKVNPVQPERYSIEDLLSQEKRILPYISNMHQSIGKLMDSAISQAIEILENHSHNKSSINNGKALRLFFYDHLQQEEICKILNCTRENVRRHLIGKFIYGEQYVEDIILSDEFVQTTKTFMDSLLYKTCNIAFEDQDIDTPEKIKFAAELSGYEILDNIKEWGDAIVLTQKSTTGITRQHLISLKKAICDAIVPVSLNTLIDNTKADFIQKNDSKDFNRQIIESFVQSNPWISTNDDGKYYIHTPYLTKINQRQGRIIYEAGEPIHRDRVHDIYLSIYKEDYQTKEIQNSLRKRIENDFFAYGKSGLWYYSEDGVEIKPANKVIAKFVDEHICFYWKDLAAVVIHLCRVNKNLSKARIRMEVTNLCYVDTNDKEHFVKKGEEGNYPSFSWTRGKRNRTNWCVNHAYEMLKDTPNGEMKWTDFEIQFKQDLLETNRPMKVLEDIMYKHSGSPDDGRVFIRENGVIRINEDVVQNVYNGDLSMYGLYRKYPEFYDSIYSLAMTELRKRQDNRMQLSDFINLAIESLKSDDVGIDRSYVRKMFENNDSLPNGLSRYNDNGTVYIKLDIAVADEETKDEVQYDVTTTSASSDEVMPSLVVSDTQRQPVSYATKFNWSEVKQALRKDLSFYDSPYWSEGITSDDVLDKFVHFISSSTNYNLNRVLPQTIYEFHYARIDRYDLNQYMLCLPIAFEALLRCINDSKKRSTYGRGISQMCEEWFPDYGRAIKYKEKKGFGKILNDMVHKRNLLLHGNSLELSPVTLVQNIVEYIALFVYTVNKYALDE